MGSFFKFNSFIIWSVSNCQPKSLWESGLSFLTVNILFKRSTPSLAHGVKSPQSLFKIPKSSYSSLNIFWRLGGSLMPFCTLKERPCASPSPWYGSCPIITILTLLYGVNFNALNIFSYCG